MDRILISLDFYMLSPPIACPRRREGFPGQHLVVIPSPQLSSIAKDPLLSDLFPTATGSFGRAPGHFVQRQAGIADFILIFVREGKGWVRTSDREDVQAGQFFLIPAGIPHCYGADDFDPWAIQWVHFRGRSAAAFAGLFPAEHPGAPISVPPGTAERLNFSSVFECLEPGYTRTNLLAAAAHLRTLLTGLYRHLATGARTTSGDAIRQSLKWMAQNLDRSSSLPELARAAGLSIPHYSSLFKQATGFSPVEHLLRLRIQRACQLLDTTGLRVNEIATEVGWDDPYYFSRCFRRITGQSPRDYRREAKG